MKERGVLVDRLLRRLGRDDGEFEFAAEEALALGGKLAHLAGEAEPRRRQVKWEGILLVGCPEFGAAELPREWPGEDLVLGSDRRQHHVLDRPMRIDERLQQRQALLGGRHRRVHEQTAGVHAHDRHSDGYMHVEDAQDLVEYPGAARHRLAHHRLPFAVRRERQRRPQRPLGAFE